MESDKKSLNKVRNKALLYEVGYEYAKSINDDINSNPDLELIKCTESVDAWFEDYCTDLVKEEKRVKRKRLFGKTMKKVAIFFGAVVLSGAILTVSVEAFRLEIFNMVIDSTSTHDNITLMDEVLNEALLPNIDSGYYLSYMPEGYVIEKIEEFSSDIQIFYKDYNDHVIIFDQMLYNDGLTLSIDNENVVEIEVEIAGNPGLLREKNGYIILFWHEKDVIFIIQGEISKKEMMKIGNSIKIIE